MSVMASINNVIRRPWSIVGATYPDQSVCKACQRSEVGIKCSVPSSSVEEGAIDATSKLQIRPLPDFTPLHPQLEYHKAPAYMGKTKKKKLEAQLGGTLGVCERCTAFDNFIDLVSAEVHPC
jgi:hypothetical protein